MTARVGGAAVHSPFWRPTSACGPSCRTGRDAHVARGTVVVRLVALIGVLLGGAVLVPVIAVLRGTARTAGVRALARALLAALGVRLALHGRVPRPGSLLVANHVSWLDAVVLLAAVPARTVSKHDVRTWPGVGAIAAACGAIFVDRSRPRTLPQTVAEVATALRAGTSVAVFPEGTTYCGADQGRFRPAMFQAAVDAGAPVVPFGVSYAAGGRTTSAAAFVGDESLWQSVRRVAALRGLTVSLVASPALHPAAGADRRALARAAQATVRLTAVSRRAVSARDLDLAA